MNIHSHELDRKTEPDQNDYARRYAETDWKAYGKAYLFEGRRQAKQRREEDGSIRLRTFSPEELAHAEKRRQIVADQTRWASHQAALFIERQKQAKTEHEFREAGRGYCERCGREIDARYNTFIFDVLKWVVATLLNAVSVG